MNGAGDYQLDVLQLTNLLDRRLLTLRLSFLTEVKVVGEWVRCAMELLEDFDAVSKPRSTRADLGRALALQLHARRPGCM